MFCKKLHIFKFTMLIMFITYRASTNTLPPLRCKEWVNETILHLLSHFPDLNMDIEGQIEFMMCDVEELV